MPSKKTAVIATAAAGGAIAWRLWKHAEQSRANRRIAGGRKILILGAGFAGMNVARELAKLLPSPQETEIRLVDQNNFLLFTPMLTEVTPLYSGR
jgi:NADPH-dependent 2,4-dienoyl-CoA reductase/sulfur reductase-like enzyme